MNEENFKKFLLSNLLKGFFGFGLVILIVIFYRKYAGNSVDEYLEPFTSRPLLMYLIFFASETIIGIIPPEFFIIWSLDENIIKFIFYVFMLALLSFSAALINFALGRIINRNLTFQKFTKNLVEKYAPYYFKWGGWIIVMAAFTPVPYAAISLVSGAVHYPTRKFLLFASSRFIRFGLYGWIILGLPV